MSPAMRTCLGLHLHYLWLYLQVNQYVTRLKIINMNRSLIFLLFLTCLPIALVSQQKRIGNQEFFQESGTWYQRTSNGENFKVDMGTVSIKFKSDQVQKIAEKYNLVEIRKSSAGYYDFRIPQKSSFFEIIESLFREPAIESIDVNTFGEYHILKITFFRKYSLLKK